MKRTVILFLAVMMIFVLSGCGKQSEPEKNEGSEVSSEEVKYAEALDVLNAVFNAYKEEDMFAVYGGNQEDAVMDAPGKFDISKAEQLKTMLGLPEDQIANIDDAASMVHMMNANTFTGAAYHLKDGQDVNAFADAVKAGIMDTQWVCGQPDTLIIIDVDGKYIITAYGAEELIATFKSNALSALSGAQVIVEAPIG